MARAGATAARAETAAAPEHCSYPEYRPGTGARIEPDGLPVWGGGQRAR